MNGKMWFFGLVLFLGVPTQSRAAVQWRLEDGGNGHYYEYVDTPVTWIAARDIAASEIFAGLTGYLATITSEQENDFIINNFNQRGWLGGSDAEVEGEWRWVVGPEAGQMFFKGEYPDPNRITLIYSDWGGNEPNDFDNTPYDFPYPGEDFLEFDPARGGEWNDAPGDPCVYDGFYIEFGGTSLVPEPATLVIWSLLGALAIIAGRCRHLSLTSV